MTQPQLITVTPSQFIQAACICVAAKRPFCVWSQPGVGKSKLMAQIAQLLNKQCLDVRAVTFDPTDVKGLPHVNGDGRSHWAVPDFLPRDGSGLFFADEINRSPQLVQNSFLQLFLDRKVGDYVLPDDWDTSAACNPDGPGVSKMSSALSLRFIHFDLEANLDDWCKWAVGAGIEPAVIAFLRFRPNLLHAYDPKERSSPNPRGWEFVSQIIAQNPPKAVELALIAGTIGHGAAIEFCAFLQLFRNIPSIDAILLNPQTAPVPANDPGSLWAVSAALARRSDAQNFKRVLTYLDRMPQEYAVMGVRDAVGRDNSLASMHEFTQWAVKHSDVVF